jgi:XRE family transcriptional regulator, regulator of sulfur utilization
LSEGTRAGELLGARVRQMRTRRGLTQVIVAERSGLPQSHVSEIERGVMIPNLVTLLRLAAALECKASTLVAALDGADVDSILSR